MYVYLRCLSLSFFPPRAYSSNATITKGCDWFQNEKSTFFTLYFHDSVRVCVRAAHHALNCFQRIYQRASQKIK